MTDATPWRAAQRTALDTRHRDQGSETAGASPGPAAEPFPRRSRAGGDRVDGYGARAGEPRWGARAVYPNLANAETDPILQILARELSERTPARVITLNGLIGIRSGYRALMRSKKPQSHGGEGETALMLATASHLVRMDRARSYHPRCPSP